jgi:hypothetical protein
MKRLAIITALLLAMAGAVRADEPMRLARMNVAVVSGSVPVVAAGYATPAWVKDISVYDSNITTNATLATVTSGNFLVMVVTGSDGQSISGVTTTAGSTSSWTSAGLIENSTNSAEIAIYWACATGAGTTSAHPTGTASDAGYTMTEYSGVACTSPQIGTLQSAVNSGTTTGFTTGTITASQTHNLLISAWASEEADKTITWGSGWGQKEDVNSHYHKTADKVITDGSGNYTASGSWSSSSSKWVSAFVMFKAASL